MSHTRLLALGAALLIGAGTAAPVLAASNLTFMSNSPLAWLQKKDNASLAKAADVALSTKQDNETVDWNNKGTGNPTQFTGQITPTNTQKTDDKTCRDLIVLLNAKGQDVTLKLNACKKGENGKWELQKRAAP